MEITFKKLGFDKEQIKQVELCGIRYKKYQKNDLINMHTLPPPNDDTINDFQRKYGKLPNDYNAFLKKNNGGVPSKCILTIDNTEIVIDRFFALAGTQNVYDSLENHIKVYQDRIPKATIPIGRSPGGDIVLMDISEVNFGKIFYWYHELENQGSGSNFYKNIMPLAKSFTALLENLNAT